MSLDASRDVLNSVQAEGREMADFSVDAVPGYTFDQFVRRLGKIWRNLSSNLLLDFKLLRAGAALYGAF